MLPRFQHILVPLDFSSKNLPALDVAFEMASLNRARTSLLHIVERIETSTEAEEPIDQDLQEFYEQLESRASSELESLSQRFDAAGLDVEYKVWRGKRVSEIVRFSRDRDVDLVVLSSHPVDAEHPVKSLATVSYQVSILCSCPVLMVK